MRVKRALRKASPGRPCAWAAGLAFLPGRLCPRRVRRVRVGPTSTWQTRRHARPAQWALLREGRAGTDASRARRVISSLAWEGWSARLAGQAPTNRLSRPRRASHAQPGQRMQRPGRTRPLPAWTAFRASMPPSVEARPASSARRVLTKTRRERQNAASVHRGNSKAATGARHARSANPEQATRAWAVRRGRARPAPLGPTVLRMVQTRASIA